MSCFVNRMQRKEQRKMAASQQEKQPKETYACSSCGHELFDAETKFESGTGFPSFWMHIDQNVRQKFLTTYGRERIQLLCSNCDQHLGHLFENKKTPTRLRYCINAAAISSKGSL